MQTTCTTPITSNPVMGRIKKTNFLTHKKFVSKRQDSLRGLYILSGVATVKSNLPPFSKEYI